MPAHAIIGADPQPRPFEVLVRARSRRKNERELGYPLLGPFDYGQKIQTETYPGFL
jgi:hypothetical protein